MTWSEGGGGGVGEVANEAPEGYITRLDKDGNIKEVRRQNFGDRQQHLWYGT